MTIFVTNGTLKAKPSLKGVFTLKEENMLLSNRFFSFKHY